MILATLYSVGADSDDMRQVIDELVELAAVVEADIR